MEQSDYQCCRRFVFFGVLFVVAWTSLVGAAEPQGDTAVSNQPMRWVVEPDGVFAAEGKLKLGKGLVTLHCETRFTGQVQRNGAFRIEQVTFKRGSFLCSRIRPEALPWRGQVDHDRQLTIYGLQVHVKAPLLGGLCGPMDVAVAWDQQHSTARFEQVELEPNCHIDGPMVTTRHFQVLSVSPVVDGRVMTTDSEVLLPPE